MCASVMSVSAPVLRLTLTNGNGAAASTPASIRASTEPGPPDLEEALARFKDDWTSLLPEVPEGAFDECRRNRAFHEWKYRMWEAGSRTPTQVPELRSKCFCGADIGVACDEHVYAGQKFNKKPRTMPGLLIV
jgi:hypothetical protein